MSSNKLATEKHSSFVCEIPLKDTPAIERHLLVRLDCARMVYNACLGESLKRLNILRESEQYREALNMPKAASGTKTAKDRTAAFREANKEVGFSEYDLHAYAKQFGHSWLGQHLDSLTIQKIASRAFNAVQQYSFGKKGKPRFKGKGSFDSVEGKTNTSGIVWRKDRVAWSGLVIPAMIDSKDEVIKHGLSCRVKYVRIVRRKISAKNRFYVQLICEGVPYRKPKNTTGDGRVGLDLGPSNSAISADTDNHMKLEKFCEPLDGRQKEIRRLQRKMDRSRRANNPDNYNTDKTIKKGINLEWENSKIYQKTRSSLAEVRRAQAEHRKSLHGNMVNRIIRLGDVIKLEKLSYRSFQKNYGKSVSFRGPGTFVSILRRKAVNAGAEVIEFSTYHTRLSQTCPACGAIQKKTLSERWHVCECGFGPIQRDILSAWLAKYVENNRLDVRQAQVDLPGVELLLRAVSSEIQPAMGQGQPKPNLAMGQSRSQRIEGMIGSEAYCGATHGCDKRAANLTFSKNPRL